MTDDEPLEYHKLNLETGLIGWQELQRYFARGVLINVDPALDLVDVAQRFVNDDKAQIETWMAAQQVSRASDAQAIEWQQRNAEFWAIVVSPWVLAQIKSSD